MKPFLFFSFLHFQLYAQALAFKNVKKEEYDLVPSNFCCTFNQVNEVAYCTKNFFHLQYFDVIGIFSFQYKFIDDTEIKNGFARPNSWKPVNFKINYLSILKRTNLQLVSWFFSLILVKFL